MALHQVGILLGSPASNYNSIRIAKAKTDLEPVGLIVLESLATELLAKFMVFPRMYLKLALPPEALQRFAWCRHAETHMGGVTKVDLLDGVTMESKSLSAADGAALLDSARRVRCAEEALVSGGPALLRVAVLGAFQQNLVTTGNRQLSGVLLSHPKALAGLGSASGP